MDDELKIPLRKKLQIGRRMISSLTSPLSASLFITRKCNLSCQYCRVIQPNWKDLDLAGWLSVIDRLHSWGVRLYSITGGEPMIRSDICNIIAHISKTRKSIPWLISNFSTMTKNKIDQLSDAGLFFLTASLDSLSDIGVKSDASILDLLEYAKSKGIICSTITVIHWDNIHEIPDIMHKVTERGIIFDIGFFQHVGGLFSTPDSDLKVKDFSLLEDIRKQMRRHKLKTGLVAPSWGYLKSDLKMYQEMSWKCPFAKDAFLVINNDGRLMPCQEYISNINVLTIEDLNDPTWRREKAEIVDRCAGCYYGCYYQKVTVSPLDALLDLYTMVKL